MKKDRGPRLYAMAACRDDGRYHVKVGIAVNPRSRRSVIQTGCPFFIHVVLAFSGAESVSHARKIERLIHKISSAHNTVGEWFEFQDEDALGGWIKDVIDPVADAFGLEWHTHRFE